MSSVEYMSGFMYQVSDVQEKSDAEAIRIFRDKYGFFKDLDFSKEANELMDEVMDIVWDGVEKQWFPWKDINGIWGLIWFSQNADDYGDFNYITQRDFADRLKELNKLGGAWLSAEIKYFSGSYYNGADCPLVYQEGN